MKYIAHLAGVRELDNINKYAREVLTEEEKRFIEKINKIVEDFKHERSDNFISFGELVELQRLWQKYEHTKPFQLPINPRKKISKVFENQTAFIIWTAWRSRHLVCQDDDVKGGSLAAAKVLSGHKIPYPKEVKQKAVEEFLKYLHASYPDAENEINFWERYIFPYLEGKWQFKWELKEES